MVAEEVAEPGTIVLVDQDFSRLEEALEKELWEVDGDDLSLYTCSDEKDGPPGAVLVTEGGGDSQAELVHRLRGGDGAQVTRLVARLILEALDAESTSIFTIGLAFDDDFEETALLAVTLRWPRENPGDLEPGVQPPPRLIQLVLNGDVAVDDVGELPAQVDIDVRLFWDEATRRATLRHRIVPVDQEPCPNAAGSAPWKETSSGFYTTNVKFDKAQVLFLRGTGASKIRLLSTSAWCAVGSDDGVAALAREGEGPA
mmetsp:Transcript_21339/g.45417  ORF Transcript_21339/g.45417 Transcript_21339/m.45417 type:complete len:257 (+) Transcript_21339:43-813(+)